MQMDDSNKKSHTNVDIPKSILRNKTFDLLKNLSSKRKQEASHYAVEKLRNLTAARHRVLSFASFKDEIDLWPLNATLLRERKLCLPSLSGKLFEILSLDSLRPSKKGFLEPDEVFCTEIKLSSIDCILVPGLLFDEKKHRLGFGGGFYDRLLEAKTKETLAIGVGFKEQLHHDALPLEPHDHPIDQLLLL